MARIKNSIVCACALALLGATETAAQQRRYLGVYSVASGEPIEGVEVRDMASGTSALTTKTGTVTLSFLPAGTSLLRLKKIGYEPFTTVVTITPDDTLPVTVLLRPAVQTLPAMVSRDSAPKHISPGLRDFEERRRSGIHGSFVGEDEMRKQDDKRITWFVRQFPGVKVNCRGSSCVATATRVQSKYAFLGGACIVEIYVDGAPWLFPNLEDLHVDEFGAIEHYAGASIPAQYNKTGSTCGVLLLWRRER
jgi:hypothetical protein